MISDKTKSCRYFNGTICKLMFTDNMDCTPCLAFRDKDEPLADYVNHDIDPNYFNNEED